MTFARSWERKIKINELIEFIRALIATPASSKVTTDILLLMRAIL
jgi:hypothetical protein